jgi:hypothetical protein
LIFTQRRKGSFLAGAAALREQFLKLDSLSSRARSASLSPGGGAQAVIRIIANSATEEGQKQSFANTSWHIFLYALWVFVSLVSLVIEAVPRDVLSRLAAIQLVRNAR